MKKRDGIRAAADILGRCKLNEAGCLLWAGCVSQGSARANVGGRNVPVPGLLYRLRYGAKVPLGMRYHAACGNSLCMKHRALVTISEAASKAPAKNPLAKRVAIKVAKTRASSISQEAVDALRSAKRGTVEKVAREFGVNLGSARAIACGQSRAPIQSASVFSFRP